MVDIFLLEIYGGVLGHCIIHYCLHNMHLVLHVVSLAASFCRLLMRHFVKISWSCTDAK